MEQLIKEGGVRAVEEDNIQPPPHYHPEDGPQIITADTARQGPRGRRVLIVLVTALIAIGIAWVVVGRFVY